MILTKTTSDCNTHYHLKWNNEGISKIMKTFKITYLKSGRLV